MDELVIPVTSSNGRQLTFSDGTAACLFGIAPAGSSTPVMGDTFIRSAYLVYDLANNEISIAQTNFNATSTNVVEIGTGSTAVPNASAVTNAVSASAGVGSGTLAGTAALGTATSKSAAERTAAPVLGALAMAGAGMLYAAM